MWTRKSQCQALDRSQPVLPMMPGMPDKRTHVYVRNGVTSLFAALDMASGKVIGAIHRRHRCTEYRKFLKGHRPPEAAWLAVHDGHAAEPGLDRLMRCVLRSALEQRQTRQQARQ